jgi:DNA gyrase inhibitor GyrI
MRGKQKRQQKKAKFLMQWLTRHSYSPRQGKTLKITKYIPRTKEHSSKGNCVF